MKRTLLGACMAALLYVNVVDAAIIDQQYVGANHMGSFAQVVGINNTQKSGQTFTVGLTGVLTAVDVYVINDGVQSLPLIVDVRTLTGGLPTPGDAGTHILASAMVQKTDVPSAADLPGTIGSYDAWGGPMLHVDLPDFSVSAGQQLAITLRSQDANFYQTVSSSLISVNDPPLLDYAGGNWLVWDTDHWLNIFSNDMGFRTYIVPEPATASLLLSGVGMIVSRRLRHP